jgi:subtilase family serine protease
MHENERKFSRLLPLVAMALGLVGGLGASQTEGSAAIGQVVANNTPKFVATAKNLGPEDPSKVIDVSIWLKMHNRAALNSIAQELYDPASSHYHQWLQPGDFAANFAPTAQEAKAVGEFLSSHNLPVVAVGPNNMFVRARGTVADVEKAFRIQIDNFDVNGKTLYANTSDPYVEGPAAALAGVVYGLDDQEFHHPLVSSTSRLPKQPSASSVETAASSADPAMFTSNCFTGVKTETYSTSGSFPIATYTGNGYNFGVSGCGYTPPEIHTAYNLTALYDQGYDGTGQTIVIID